METNIDEDTLYNTLTNSILLFCQNSMKYSECLNIQGTLAITTDYKDILVIQINKSHEPLQSTNNKQIAPSYQIEAPKSKARKVMNASLKRTPQSFPQRMRLASQQPINNKAMGQNKFRQQLQFSTPQKRLCNNYQVSPTNKKLQSTNCRPIQSTMSSNNISSNYFQDDNCNFNQDLAMVPYVINNNNNSNKSNPGIRFTSSSKVFNQNIAGLQQKARSSSSSSTPCKNMHPFNNTLSKSQQYFTPPKNPQSFVPSKNLQVFTTPIRREQSINENDFIETELDDFQQDDYQESSNVPLGEMSNKKFKLDQTSMQMMPISDNNNACSNIGKHNKIVKLESSNWFEQEQVSTGVICLESDEETDKPSKQTTKMANKNFALKQEKAIDNDFDLQVLASESPSLKLNLEAEVKPSTNQQYKNQRLIDDSSGKLILSEKLLPCVEIEPSDKETDNLVIESYEKNTKILLPHRESSIYSNIDIYDNDTFKADSNLSNSNFETNAVGGEYKKSRVKREWEEECHIEVGEQEQMMPQQKNVFSRRNNEEDYEGVFEEISIKEDMECSNQVVKFETLFQLKEEYYNRGGDSNQISTSNDSNNYNNQATAQQQNQHTCSHCNFAFPTLRTMRQHIKQIHTNE